MQNPSSFQPVPPSFPEQEHLKCPRCDSSNTKFCYYNNYNLSQPRHFCKNCRRYWTKGGSLRNIPIGGGTRKTTKRSSNPKRQSSSSSSSVTSSSSVPLPRIAPKPEEIGIFGQAVSPVDQDRQLLDITGSFSSLLASNGQFGNLFEGLNSVSSPNLPTFQFGDFTEHSNSSSIESPTLELQNTNTFLSIQGGGDSTCWGNGNGNGWPDLAIHTPGSSFE